MSRESDWIEAILRGEFPDDVEFQEGSRPNHIVISWTVVGPDDAARRNAPIVIIVDAEAIDRYDTSNDGERARIEARVCEIVGHRCRSYDPNGAVDVSMPFVVEIDEGDL
ncbi:hypothetical protein [Paraburkholderia bannensis]|uniref:hypothetical protein n=1 Tax=Paraburkholderia bannensis TaxID=765414 RepID=UPI002AC366A8|nr:hypothetical protein [Paraburkholderia bannensis]